MAESFSGNAQIKKYLKRFWVSYVILIGVIILFFISVAFGLFGKMPTFDELENPKSNLATEVISSDGKLLG